MSTNCNGIRKVWLIWSGIESFHCLIYQNIISCPVAVWCISLDVHKLLAGERIKSHHGECVYTAVEVTTIVMYRMCSISDRSQIRCSTLTISLLQNCFIRIFTGSKIFHAHSGKYFKLCIRCTGTNYRNGQISACIFLFKFVECRNRILVVIQEINLVRITEGL